MFSVKGDTILDPFSGTGTTSMAAMASGRNSIGVDLNEGLVANTQTALQALPEFANRYIRERLRSHMEFVRQRIDSGKTLKHRNENYDFEVVTGQEKELLFNDINSVTIKEGVIVAAYGETPQADLGSGWLRSAAGDTPNPTLQATLQL